MCVKYKRDQECTYSYLPRDRSVCSAIPIQFTFSLTLSILQRYLLLSDIEKDENETSETSEMKKAMDAATATATTTTTTGPGAEGVTEA